jgi:hypothetical protein
VSSGSASTTHVVRPKLFQGEASMLTAAAGRLYFTTQGGHQLWSTDGSAGGERQLVASHAWDWFVPNDSEPGERIDIATFGGRAWFPSAREYSVPGGDGGTRADIWSSDGTAAGTHQ